MRQRGPKQSGKTTILTRSTDDVEFSSAEGVKKDRISERVRIRTAALLPADNATHTDPLLFREQLVFHLHSDRMDELPLELFVG
jgi:hypothetical protein